LLDKDNAGLYERNYQELVAKIDAEFESLRREFAPLSEKPVFVYHPAFGYFLDEFNIRQEAVETGGRNLDRARSTHLLKKPDGKSRLLFLSKPSFPLQPRKR
jgi:zinc transport system substrate-binding protein